MTPSDKPSIPEWQQRVLDERGDLQAKCEKLRAFILGPKMDALQYEDAQLLQEQARHMRFYLQTLEMRIERFKS